jgi:hypothetical protein
MLLVEIDYPEFHATIEDGHILMKDTSSPTKSLLAN